MTSAIQIVHISSLMISTVLQGKSMASPLRMRKDKEASALCEFHCMEEVRLHSDLLSSNLVVSRGLVSPCLAAQMLRDSSLLVPGFRPLQQRRLQS